MQLQKVHLHIILWRTIFHLDQSSFKLISLMFNSKFSCAHLKSEVVVLHVLALLAENSENSFRTPVLNQYYQMLQIENQINSFLTKELKKRFFFFKSSLQNQGKTFGRWNIWQYGVCYSKFSLKIRRWRKNDLFLWWQYEHRFGWIYILIKVMFILY